MGAMYKIIPRFAARIRELRKAKKMTQEKLAELSGLHVVYISMIETGKHNTTMKTLSKLAKGLKVPVWEIFLGMERDRDLPKAEHLKFKGLLKKGPGKPPLVDEKGRRLRPIRKSGKKPPETPGKSRRKP
jgi:transcriptional regulator with XRE-family HTH domain